MNTVVKLIVPVTVTFVLLYGVCRGVDVFSVFVRGAEKGLRTILRIFPNLLLLMTCVYMLRASGALDALTQALSPLLQAVGIPAETVPLMLLRPISGSGALAIGSDIMQKYGVDSVAGRTAAVMLGSTETTFYVVTVYFGAVGIRKTRYAIPAAVIADIVGFLTAALTVRYLF